MAESGNDRNSGFVDPSTTSLLSEEKRSATLAQGEHVNQKFIECSINVATGDQIYGNKNIYYVDPLRWPTMLVHGEPSPVSQVSDERQKQQVLARSIRQQLEQTKDVENYTRMELYTAMYESDNDDLMRNLSVINASDMALSCDEAHILGSLTARNASLDVWNLSRCRIGDDLLTKIAGCLKDRIHVDHVNLLDSNHSATALQSLLGHPRIESLSGNLDWKSVSLTARGHRMTLTNEGDLIKILPLSDTSGSAVDHFDIKESTLVFEECTSLAILGYCWMLFKPERFHIPDQQLYVKQYDLRDIAKSKLEKVGKILLLDCTRDKNIDWLLVETSVKKYQIDLVDIAVNGQVTSTEEYDRILKHGNDIASFGFRLNIHSMFYIEDEDDFREMLEACQRTKIENIRCIVKNSESAAELETLINTSPDIKKVTLIRWSFSHKPQATGLRGARNTSDERATESEYLRTSDHRRVKDAWSRLDDKFYHKEEKRRSYKNQHMSYYSRQKSS